MVILGISDNHDSGASLIMDGRIKVAVNEERISRRKLAGGFPYLSVKCIMDSCRIPPEDISTVVLASTMTPASWLRAAEGFHEKARHSNGSFGYLLNLYIIYQVLANKLKIPELCESFLSSGVIGGKLKKSGLKARVVVVDHHTAHAASAYYTSGSGDPTLVVTADAMGDGLSVTVSIGEGKVLRRIYSQSGFSAISTYYSRLTEFLGFVPLRHEGKITSLAGFGRENEDILLLARSSLRFLEGKRGFNLKNHFIKEGVGSRFYRRLSRFRREDIAYNFQANFEEQLAAFVRFWVNRTGIRRVSLSGGAFANVSLNQRIAGLNEVESLYIFPHMGDGGLSLGAALAYLKPEPFPLENIYLGPEYPGERIKNAVLSSGLPHSLLDEDRLCARLAELIAAGVTVGHFNSRMEYGPRALGNRSIFYRADDPSCMEWFNDRLQRDKFMPFAPVSLDVDSGELYRGTEKTGYTLKFMNVALDCTEKMKSACPGAVHIDGTARPQVLARSDNPRVYRTLEIYKALSGAPAFLNTSFNKHEEPIVASPEDAISSFISCGLDYLVLNNFLLWKKSN